MVLRRENLPRDVDQLLDLALAQSAEIEALKVALKTVQALTMGARSERLASIAEGQLPLDLGDLATGVTPAAANDDGPAKAALVPVRPRKRARRNIGFLPKHLPRVDEVIEPASLQCPCCAGGLHKIGQDVNEALDAVPAILRVLRTIRPKYACRDCAGPIVQASAKLRLFDGGMATTALIASVVVWKFAWHMPLNRQLQMLAGHGVNIDNSTACRWVKRAAWYLKGLYELQMSVMHRQDRLFCDETRMPVRRRSKKTVHIGQFWTHVVDDSAWSGPARPAVIYVYAEGRGHREIKAQLADYQGLLQVDGYAGYNGLTKAGRQPGPIKLAFCLAHARRKFTDIYKATQSPFAKEVIEQMAEIYAIEERIRGTSATFRQQVRQTRTAPLMAKLETDLRAALTKLSKKSKLAAAIRYSLGHWPGLTLFLKDGRLEADNNTVERMIRPIALGRKNSHFAGDDGGAETWAILASLLNTAKLNGLDPYTYLHDVLERIVSGEVKNNNLEQLLAWNWTPGAKVAPLAAAA